MIANIVNVLKVDLNELGVFDELGGIVKPFPFSGKTLPFDCNSSLDECKNGAELQPSSKRKMLGFFELEGDVKEVEEVKKQKRFKGNLKFNVWYKCDSITVQNKGIDVNCCDKGGFIKEAVINTIKNTDLKSDLFSNVSLQNYVISDYDWKGYSIDPKSKFRFHPYYAFTIEFDVYFILNSNCADAIDITLTKEVC